MLAYHSIVEKNDESDNPVAHDDVHTKVERCRAHFEKVGIGAAHVRKFLR